MDRAAPKRTEDTEVLSRVRSTSTPAMETQQTLTAYDLHKVDMASLLGGDKILALPQAEESHQRQSQSRKESDSRKRTSTGPFRKTPGNSEGGPRKRGRPRKYPTGDDSMKARKRQRRAEKETSSEEDDVSMAGFSSGESSESEEELEEEEDFCVLVHSPAVSMSSKRSKSSSISPQDRLSAHNAVSAPSAPTSTTSTQPQPQVPLQYLQPETPIQARTETQVQAPPHTIGVVEPKSVLEPAHPVRSLVGQDLRDLLESLRTRLSHVKRTS